MYSNDHPLGREALLDKICELHGMLFRDRLELQRLRATFAAAMFADARKGGDEAGQNSSLLERLNAWRGLREWPEIDRGGREG